MEILPVFNWHVPDMETGLIMFIHINQGFGTQNAEGYRLLDLCAALDLAMTCTYSKKQDTQVISYKSGSSFIQLD